MTLPLPDLDDKRFSQIAGEARALIPTKAREWTDHNVHDPGITFLELFAWLAEIEHYRLNRTSAASFARFLALVGLTPHPQQAAQVEILFEFSRLDAGVLVPARTRVSAISHEDVPFQTTRDLYLTAARLVKIVTRAGDGEIAQTRAERHDAGHYEAFGPSPVSGDALELGFENWFDEEQGHLGITLFEADLPERQPFAPDAKGFIPSARIRWEYRTNGGWTELPVIEDGTLHLSRSGELIFRKPATPPLAVRDNDAGESRDLHWIRAVLAEGQYEIPPRIFTIATNTIRARQVETIVNEDLGVGLGTPDQEVRLRKPPLLLDTSSSAATFQVGDVLDWTALVMRLAKPRELHEPRQAELVEYVARRLRKDAGAVIEGKVPTDEERYRLAEAFDRLLDVASFYERKRFAEIQIPEEFLELIVSASRAFQELCLLRPFNRFLLQRVFPDLMVSDRLEIQTGNPVATVEEEPKSWSGWEIVEDFSKSGPDDRHYQLDPETGRILFGNGLNGRVPLTTERIRARFYHHSGGATGNVPRLLQWNLGVNLPDGTQTLWRQNWTAATGGKDAESLDEAKGRSRQLFRTQFPMLTAKDYETQALRTPGLRVALAKVVANFNPKIPILKLPGEVTVVVAPQPPPKTAFPNATPIRPSEGFLRTVRNYLETRRLVTTNIHVVGPHYVKVAVRGRVFLKKGASASEVGQAVRKALSEFLDPIRGGPDGDGWQFGRSVFPSEIYQQLAKIAGVDYVAGVALNTQKAGEPLALPYNGLPTPGVHEIETVAFEKRKQDAHVRKEDCQRANRRKGEDDCD